MNKGVELAICIAGIYVCFLTWGITQERVSTTLYQGKKFNFFIFLNAAQALIASIVGWSFIKLTKKSVDHISSKMFVKYIQLSFLHCIASPFGYAALKHIDYPTLILGKSCKLIPVMLMNFLIYRKTYPWQKYLIVLLITTGVSSFMLWQPAKPGKHSDKTLSLYGIGLLMMNLLIDGLTNATQDNIFKRFKVNGSSMMMYMNAFSSIMMLAFLAFNPYSSELKDAIQFCVAAPKVVNDILLFGFCGAIGQCFIFYTLEKHGSLVLVTVTVTRKMFSILLSVFLFGHTLNLPQWGSVALVFSGILWESYGKGERKSKVEEVVVDETELLVEVRKSSSNLTPRRSSRLKKKAE